MINNIKKELFNLDSLKQVVFSFVSGIIVYFSFISNNLLNDYDGLWYSKYFIAWKHEIGSGRFFWTVIDTIKQGIATDPLNSLVFLIIISVSNVILIKSLKIRKQKLIYITIPFLVCSTSVLCMMSYRFQSPDFGIAYLLSSCSLYLFIFAVDNNDKKYIFIFSSALLSLSLACYQSFIGCFCLGVILHIINSIITNQESFKESLLILLKAIIVVTISAVIYKLLWDFIMNLLNMTANNYNGAESLSIKDMIIGFPNSLLLTYNYYFYFIFSDSYKINIYNFKPFLLIAICILLYFSVYIVKNKKYYILLYIILLIPSANFSIFFVNSGMMMQQTYSLSILLPLLSLVVVDNLDTIFIKHSSICKSILAIIVLISFFGNLASVEIDVEAMREGKRSVENILFSVENKIINDDYYSEDDEYYIIGIPCENPLFRTSEIWDMANEYAKFGKWWDKPHTSNRSYQGTIDDMGINIQCLFGSTNSFVDVISKDYVKDMPLFPYEGSIIKENNKVIIKISNNYSNYTD